MIDSVELSIHSFPDTYLKQLRGILMRKIFFALLTIVFFGFAQPSYATQEEFCTGFAEGYKSIKGDMVIVPICPIAPVTPIGSNDFREGLKAGMAAAQRR